MALGQEAQTQQPAPQQPTQQAVPSAPTQMGVYYKEASTWKFLDKAPLSLPKAKGTFGMVMSGGIAAAKISCVTKGVTSPSVINGQPEFRFVAMQSLISVRDIAIVKFQINQGNRELLVSKIHGMWSGYQNPGYRPEDLVGVVVETNSDGSLTVKPQTQLPAGEYLLVGGGLCAGWDFTVAATNSVPPSK